MRPIIPSGIGPTLASSEVSHHKVCDNTILFYIKKNTKIKENLETSLIYTLGSNSIEFTKDVGELVLDQFIDNEFLKDIPVFSVLFKGIKTFKGIREAIFAMKIYKFLKEFESVKESQTNSLIAKISESKKERVKVGQALIMIIDKIDDLDKTEILVNLFLAYLKGHLSIQEFIHLGSITQNIFITYLTNFCTIDDIRKLRPEVESHLANSGLLIPFVMDFKSMHGERYIIDKNDYILLYSLSPIGQQMRKYGKKASS